MTFTLSKNMYKYVSRNCIQCPNTSHVFENAGCNSKQVHIRLWALSELPTSQPNYSLLLVKINFVTHCS